MDTPMGMSGDNEDAGDPGEGGPSVLMHELAQLRWMTQQEAVNVGNMPLDPTAWDDGQLTFEYERTIAHAHEALRDQLSNHVTAKVRDEVRDLYELAGEVAVVRDELRVVDRDLVTETRLWRSLFSDIRQDELELGRFFRLRSKKAQDLKRLIAAVFILSEFSISVVLFTGPLAEGDNPFAPYIFALGLMVMLVVIPHYSSMGIKAGLSRHHEFERKAYEEDQGHIPFRVQRKTHMEAVDDRGFRFIAGTVGLVLVILILPLSSLRATELSGDGSWVLWFLFTLFLQTGISGYFFLREWLDHSQLSQNFHERTESKESLEAERSGILSDLADATAAFHESAEDLLFTLREAPRWDSYIVQSYLSTIHSFRHIISVQQADLAPFISWARIPYLGSETDSNDAMYPLDPVSREHRSLDEDNSFGREWWMRRMSEALVEIPESEIEDTDGDGHTDASWLITRSPTLLLREYLRRYFDLSDRYRRPAELDDPGVIADEDRALLDRVNDDPLLLDRHVPADTSNTPGSGHKQALAPAPSEGQPQTSLNGKAKPSDPLSPHPEPAVSPDEATDQPG